MTHSIAEMMHRVRAKPGLKGLVTANGNYVTKHSAGIYSTDEASQPFAPENPATYQAALDAQPRPSFTALAEGSARIETYTVMNERAGPTSSILMGRLDDGTRFIANTEADAGLLAEMQSTDFIGRAGKVNNDGTRNIFTPL